MYSSDMLTLKTFKAEVLLLLAAIIWGFAFVAQRIGMDHVGPFTYNGVRFLLGALSLLPLLWIGRRASPLIRPGGERLMLGGGLLVGLILFAGASLQQVGIIHTTAGRGPDSSPVSMWSSCRCWACCGGIAPPGALG